MQNHWKYMACKIMIITMAKKNHHRLKHETSIFVLRLPQKSTYALYYIKMVI